MTQPNGVAAAVPRPIQLNTPPDAVEAKNVDATIGEEAIAPPVAATPPTSHNSRRCFVSLSDA